jgi:hypothetical protein
MRPTWIPLSALILATMGRACAQNAIVAVDRAGHRQVVAAVRGLTPVGRTGEDWMSPAIGHLILEPRPNYAEGVAEVRVDRFSVEEFSQPSDSPARVAVRFRAELTPSRSISFCYLAVVVDAVPTAEPRAPRHGAKGLLSPKIVLRELPDLSAGEMTSIDMIVPIAGAAGGSAPAIHLYSGTDEVLLSTLGATRIAEERRKTEADVLARIADRAPTPIHRVAPVVSPAFEARQLPAKACVRCRIGKDGNLVGTTLESCTAGEFGDAAIVAVGEWHFLPAIRDHRFVESEIAIPFHHRTTD